MGNIVGDATDTAPHMASLPTDATGGCPHMPLTDTTIRNAKAAAKPRRLADGGGLTLSIRPNGTKAWRLRYRFGGKEQQLSLGIYPDVSLQEARRRRAEYRRLLADGVNPSGHRKAAEDDSPPETVEAVAREWHNRKLPEWTEKHARNIESRLRRIVYPAIGKQSIADVSAPDLLAMLTPLQKQEQYDLTHRVKSECHQIFDYAVATGRIQYNFVPSVKAALTKVQPTHFAAVTDPKEIGPLLRMLDGYEGSLVVMGALRLAPLVFVRPGELRQARWEDVDLDAAEWRFLVSKTQTDLVVPLSRQAVRILGDLHPHTAHQKWVFPGARNNGRPMSENAVQAALRSLGIPPDKMTGHGFRALARTALQEQLGYPVHVIEMQLAHNVRDALGTTYNRTSFRAERKAMMQQWSDYLDRLRGETTA